MPLPRDWPALVDDHAAAVEQFVRAARPLGGERWTAPIAPGKWSPAEITAHLHESYAVLRDELAGKGGMRIVVPPLKRWVIRLIYVPRILRTGRFPAGARAPREVRPRVVEPDCETAIAALEELTGRFMADLAERAAAGRVRLTHAYFGRLPLHQTMQFLSTHTRHHARQLEQVTR